MIDIKELRVGNLLYSLNCGVKDCTPNDNLSDGPEKKEVGPVEPNMFFVWGKRGLSFEGIPLTEEWLLKFGFVEYSGKHFDGYALYEEDDKNKEFNPRLIITDRFDARNFLEQPIGEVELQYVHELQNLFHALTKQELTLKEPVINA